MRDLLGEVTDMPTKQKRKGHAAPPGSGPAGKTCRSCKHYAQVQYHDKFWRKCELMRHAWTHGPGSDIRAKDPACRFYKEKSSDQRRADQEATKESDHPTQGAA